jgi:4-amino-4-deoxy-L-arabinose transferase-like glycosyltransferase
MTNSITGKSFGLILAVCIASAVYLFFSLYMLDLPGIQYDEALFTNAALGNVDNSYIAWDVPIFGIKYPMMLMGYIGALKSYLYAPVFALFGMNPFTFRLPVVLFGLMTLLLTFLVVRRMFGPATAVISALLLAADPNFIYANKLDWGPVSLMLLLQMASLYCIVRWLAEGRLRFLILGGLFLGLGLFNKVIFVWFLLALFVSLLIFYRVKIKERINRRAMISFAAALLLGCLPLIAYNISTNMGSFAGRAGFSRDWGSTLSYQAHIFYITLDGSALYNVVNLADPAHDETYSKMSLNGFADGIINKLAGIHSINNTLTPLYAGIAICLILLLLVLKKSKHWREICFFMSLLFFMIVFILLTPEATGAHHAIAIFPIPHILIGYAIIALGGLAAGPLTKNAAVIRRGAIIAICIAPILFSQLTTNARYLQSFQTYGGVRYWTDAIYNLAGFASRQPKKTFLLMDWGLSNQLLLLSRTTIKKEQYFGDFLGMSEEKKIDRLHSMLMRANVYFVFNSPPFEAFPLLETFQNALKIYNLESIKTTFYQRNGQPAYFVYEIVPKSRSEN